MLGKNDVLTEAQNVADLTQEDKGVSYELKSRSLKEEKVFLYQKRKGWIEMLHSKMCCYCRVVGLKFHVMEEKNVIPRRLYKNKSFRDMNVNLQILNFNPKTTLKICARE